MTSQISTVGGTTTNITTLPNLSVLGASNTTTTIVDPSIHLEHSSERREVEGGELTTIRGRPVKFNDLLRVFEEDDNFEAVTIEQIKRVEIMVSEIGCCVCVLASFRVNATLSHLIIQYHTAQRNQHDKFFDGAVMNFNYCTLLVVASVIAGLGLVTNSSATIIASMLGKSMVLCLCDVWPVCILQLHIHYHSIDNTVCFNLFSFTNHGTSSCNSLRCYNPR